MQKAQQYISSKYDNRSDWFVEFVNEVHNQQKINNVINIKNYLSGKHKILSKEGYEFNGKYYEPKKIVLNQAHTIINFQTSFLLGEPTTITGEETIVKELSKVYRKAKYDRLNYNILQSVLKYGEIFEYVYIDDNVIKSKLIDASESFPLYDHDGKMIAFIQAYNFDGIDYYIVYYNDIVQEFNNEGGRLKQTGQYVNLTGLPIHYRSGSEFSEFEGVSELEKWVNILDNMEELLSRAFEAHYKAITGIPVMSGQQTFEPLNEDAVGNAGLQLDDGGDFKFVANSFDSKAFSTLYDKLIDALYENAQIPAITMGRTDISNISSESTKMLFQLSIMRGQMNEQFLREGFDERFSKIVRLLELKGIRFNDEQKDSLNVVFKYALPSSEENMIKAMKELREMKAISLETIVSNSPFITDVAVELDRLKNERTEIKDSSDNDINDNIDDNVVDDIVDDFNS